MVQVQERLTIQISEALKEVLQLNDAAVINDADHLCVASRGIKDTNSLTITANYSGKFENAATKQEFLAYLHHNK